MANGKGHLDCYYCEHYQKRSEERFCAFHNVVLPDCSARLGHQICCNFEANPIYWRDSSRDMPPARRFAWFGTDLKANAIYEYSYTNMNGIEAVLEVRAGEGS